MVLERSRPLIEEGATWPQSRGSQLAGAAVGCRAGERCSTSAPRPGGRRRSSPRWRRRSSPSRSTPAALGSSRRTPRDMGARNLTVVCADALELPADLSGFDRVLVDAPCSGLGVLNSRPDLRWRAQPLPELQVALLARRSNACKPGGRSRTPCARPRGRERGRRGRSWGRGSTTSSVPKRPESPAGIHGTPGSSSRLLLTRCARGPRSRPTARPWLLRPAPAMRSQ